MCLIKRFADFTQTSWDVVWNKTVGEVLSIIAFAKEYDKQQQKLMERWRKKH